MAGGMNKRGNYGSMADRLARTREAQERAAEKFGHGSPEHLERPPGGSNIEPWTHTARHCWVILTRGREPGFLLDWRRIANDRWEGLVVRQIPGGHTVTWIPASMLEPVESR